MRKKGKVSRPLPCFHIRPICRGQTRQGWIALLDLSFNRFDRDTELTVLPPDLAVLMVGVTARQAASLTAAVQAGLVRAAPAPSLFAPLDGAFNGPMARALTQWRAGE